MHVFTEPLALRSGVTLPNRLLMAPITTEQSFYDGTISEAECRYYAERAGGLGAVITGATAVQATGLGFAGAPLIAQDRAIPALQTLASTIHGQGAKAIIQLFHAGRMATRATIGGLQPVAPSPVAVAGGETPRALSIDEIHTIIAAFGDATRRAIQAGFDGVELHMANGYLLQQFFSPHANRRTDAYGGTRDARFRFLQELLQSVFTAVDIYAARPFAVGLRLSPEEATDPGIRFTDTLWLVEQLRATRLDYLHISLGDYQRRSQDATYSAKPMLGYIHDVLQGEIPLIGVGGVRTRNDVSAVLDDTEAVAIGKQLLFDPTWPLKLAHGGDAAMMQMPFGEALTFTPFTPPLRAILEQFVDYVF